MEETAQVQEVETQITEPTITNVRLTGEETNEVVENIVAEKPKVEVEAPKEQVTNTIDETPIEKKEVEAEVKVEKKYDPFEELGIAEQKEYAQKVIEAMKANKLQEFLENTTKDYDAMKDHEMLRLDLRIKNPTANQRQLEILERKELKSLGIDIDDLESEESIEGLELLALNMAKVREERKAEQKQYTIPTFEGNKEQEIVATKQREEYEKYLNSNEDLRTFERDKFVQVGETKLDYPEGFSLRPYLDNPSSILAVFEDGNNGVNMQLLAATLLLAKNPEKHLADARKAGYAAAEKAHFDEQRNPQLGSTTVTKTVDADEPVITNVRYSGQY